MKNVKHGLRLLVMALLLILAVFGIGLTGNFMNQSRERYMDREIKTEKVEKKDENEEDDKVKR